MQNVEAIIAAARRQEEQRALNKRQRHERKRQKLMTHLREARVFNAPPNMSYSRLKQMLRNYKDDNRLPNRENRDPHDYFFNRQTRYNREKHRTGQIIENRNGININGQYYNYDDNGFITMNGHKYGVVHAHDRRFPWYSPFWVHNAPNQRKRWKSRADQGPPNYLNNAAGEFYVATKAYLRRLPNQENRPRGAAPNFPRKPNTDYQRLWNISEDRMKRLRDVAKGRRIARHKTTNRAGWALGALRAARNTREQQRLIQEANNLLSDLPDPPSLPEPSMDNNARSNNSHENSNQSFSDSINQSIAFINDRLQARAQRSINTIDENSNNERSVHSSDSDIRDLEGRRIKKIPRDLNWSGQKILPWTNMYINNQGSIAMNPYYHEGDPPYIHKLSNHRHHAELIDDPTAYQQESSHRSEHPPSSHHSEHPPSSHHSEHPPSNHNSIEDLIESSKSLHNNVNTRPEPNKTKGKRKRRLLTEEERQDRETMKALWKDFFPDQEFPEEEYEEESEKSNTVGPPSKKKTPSQNEEEHEKSNTPPPPPPPKKKASKKKASKKKTATKKPEIRISPRKAPKSFELPPLRDESSQDSLDPGLPKQMPRRKMSKEQLQEYLKRNADALEQIIMTPSRHKENYFKQYAIYNKLVTPDKIKRDRNGQIIDVDFDIKRHLEQNRQNPARARMDLFGGAPYSTNAHPIENEEIKNKTAFGLTYRHDLLQQRYSLRLQEANKSVFPDVRARKVAEAWLEYDAAYKQLISDYKQMLKLLGYKDAEFKKYTSPTTMPYQLRKLKRPSIRF